MSHMFLDEVSSRHEIYKCNYCAGRSFGFEGPTPDGPFYKFPPTIGSTGNANILFVGINPRRSNTNNDLHDALMENIQIFDELAGNRYNKGHKYIEDEKHYKDHIFIVKSLFPKQPFEEVAAVTELFFCATPNAQDLPVENSPCANLFLQRTILQLRPKVIIPVGKMVLRYFQKCFRKREEVFKVKIGNYQFWLIPMPHPNARGKHKKGGTDWTIKNVRLVFNGSLPSYKTISNIGSSPPSTVANSNLRLGIPPWQTACQPITTYRCSRLCFRADKIEPLSETDHFRIDTPMGGFQMSKANFYEDFSNVVQSNAYQNGRRIYHYPKVPERAFKYLLEDGNARLAESNTNELVTFFQKHHNCCDNGSCTTCGGMSFLYNNLCNTIKIDDLARHLKSLTLGDFKTLEDHDKEDMIIKALKFLDDQGKPDVLKAWEDTLLLDPGFASMLVYRLETLSRVSLPSTRYAILSSLENRIIFDEQLRESLRGFDEAKESHDYIAACSEYEQYQIYLAKRRNLATKQREDYLNGFLALPFVERMKKICSDSSIESEDMRVECYQILEDELFAIPREALHTLIEIIEQSKHSHFLSDLRQKLTDQRHKLRLERMDDLRSSLHGISPEDQLTKLILNKEIPVEDYPVELAEAATKDFINSLKPEDRDRFGTLLSHTPLRAWKRAKIRSMGMTDRHGKIL